MENIIWGIAFFFSPLYIYTAFIWVPSMFLFPILSGEYFKKDYEGMRTPFSFIDIIDVEESTGRIIGLFYSFTTFALAYLLFKEEGALVYLGGYSVFLGIMMLIGVIGSFNEKK